MVIQGFNVNVSSQRSFLSVSQEQGSRDIFENILNNAQEERTNRSQRNSPAAQLAGTENHRTPTNPMELRAAISRWIYEMLTSRFSQFRTQPHQQAENIDGSLLNTGLHNSRRSLDISSFIFSAAFGFSSIQQTQGTALRQVESFHFESETVSYQANGIVHTADGKTIKVDINMQVSRQFTSFMNISSESMLPVDPLVINYGGTVASLMGERFLFDLTMDGNLDSLSVLGEGNGFLAIDRNGDGKINDGSELFGPKTGCGFSELRKYDTDGNGWIDANDEIFDKLVVWSRDANGNDKVVTLKELGIGAIFLGDISTEFSFKGEENETLGVMRSTSFFLKHCGGAGTLSHIDFML